MRLSWRPWEHTSRTKCIASRCSGRLGFREARTHCSPCERNARTSPGRSPWREFWPGMVYHLQAAEKKLGKKTCQRKAWPKDEWSRSQTMRTIRHSIERSLDLPLTEDDPIIPKVRTAVRKPQVMGGPQRQQLPLKINWKTSLLPKKPIFKCELLFLGKVSQIIINHLSIFSNSKGS